MHQEVGIRDKIKSENRAGFEELIAEARRELQTMFEETHVGLELASTNKHVHWDCPLFKKLLTPYGKNKLPSENHPRNLEDHPADDDERKSRKKQKSATTIEYSTGVTTLGAHFKKEMVCDSARVSVRPCDMHLLMEQAHPGHQGRKCLGAPGEMHDYYLPMALWPSVQ